MLFKRFSWMLLLVALVVTTAACGPQQDQPVEGDNRPGAADESESAAEATADEAPAGGTAFAVLSGQEGSGVSGTVVFTETDAGVAIHGQVSGVERAGLHGFHVHETGDCSAADFTSAGGHFTTSPDAPHAGPQDDPRHAGDLGNIEVGEDGTGHLNLISTMLSLGSDANSIVGKAVILHDGEDDLVSQPTGAAGGRLACGVIMQGEIEEPIVMGDEEEDGGDEAPGVH